MLLLQLPNYYKTMLPVIEIENKISQICPKLQIGLIKATVANSATPDALWEKICNACLEIKSKYQQLTEINKRPAIAATRTLYRNCGKDPNRYRVASEALCRRAAKGADLYRINSVVDIINLVSIKSGYPISGLDADKIIGPKLSLSIGEHGETFHGIGRGLLNIEYMPVYRDAAGGIATPTSDEERTKIDISTTTVQININAFAPEMPLDETIGLSVSLLKEFCNAQDIETSIHTPYETA